MAIIGLSTPHWKIELEGERLKITLTSLNSIEITSPCQEIFPLALWGSSNRKAYTYS